MSGIPVTEILHDTNHTQVSRECVIHKNHLTDKSIINNLTIRSWRKDFSNLFPGLYKLIVSGEVYYFDLYIMIGRDDILHIDNPYYAYADVGGSTYPIIIYKEAVDGTYTATSSGLNNISGTVNDEFDMFIVSGKTIRPASNPSEIRSISSLKLITSNDSENNTEDELIIPLKNNIKSLPNGTHDTFFLNAFQQQNHIIYRVGRRILTGNEDWQLIEELSNDDTYLFFVSDKHVKAEDAADNLQCSIFNNIKSSTLINKSNTDDGICTGYGPFGEGFFIRIAKSKISEDPFDMPNSLKDWLNNQIYNNNPVIVEYELSETDYATVLLDEYHVKTFYPSTNISIGDYDISYFYKSCKL